MNSQSQPSKPNPSPKAKQRLAKVLASAGVAARRKAELLIESGHVTVNGQVVTTLPAFVNPQTDHIAVDGQPLELTQTRVLYAFYKPRGVISTLSDESGKRNLASFLPPGSNRLFPVGRLDEESEGLLLLTNDGQLALELAHPRYEHQKIYRVWIDGSKDRTPAQMLSVLGQSRRVAGAMRRFDAVSLVGREPGLIILDVTVHEGLRHLVRRMLDAAGYTVRRLIRIQHGPYQLGTLKPGEVRSLDILPSPEKS